MAVTIKNELIRRAKLFQKCKQDAAFRAEELERCKADKIYWIENWGYTFDPRVKPSTLPMILWDKQKEYIRFRTECERNQEGSVTVKQRDVGASWLVLFDHVWHLLFVPQSVSIVGSRKEMLLDRSGDMGSLFERARFILRHIPDFMKPGEITSAHMRIACPSTGSAILAESGENLGRGNRASFIDIDESSYLQNPEAVDSAVSQASKVIHHLSTPAGIGNPFWQKAHNPAWKQFRFRVGDDPRKTEADIERQRELLDPRTFASEVLGDFAGSAGDLFFPAEWVMAAVNLKIPPAGRFGCAGLDVSSQGSAETVLTILRGGNLVERVETWRGLHSPQSASKARILMLENRANHLNFDVIGVGDGVHGQLKALDSEIVGGIGFSFHAMNNSNPATERLWDDDKMLCRDKFTNIRAESFYRLRERFRKTFLTVKGIKQYPLADLISIPDDALLISQLTTPLMIYDSKARIGVESKKDLAARLGSNFSIDRADSLILANWGYWTGIAPWGRTKVRWTS